MANHEGLGAMANHEGLGAMANHEGLGAMANHEGLGAMEKTTFWAVLSESLEGITQWACSDCYQTCLPKQ